MKADRDDYQAWIGRSQTLIDVVDRKSVADMAAFVGADVQVDMASVLPNFWHCMFFAPPVPLGKTGEDGHAKRGGFMPPVPLQRRMFAGAKVDFLTPLYVGDHIACESRIKNINPKTGKSGALVFVEIEDDIKRGEQVAVRQTRSIVYRDRGLLETAGVQENAPDYSNWQVEITPDPVMLFRFSALTSNSHRIHYDRSYAKDVELYPGLVVHGPLIALQMLTACERANEDRAVESFSFRAVSPLFDTNNFTVAGRLKGDGIAAELWAADVTGRLAMTGAVTFA